MLDTMPRICIKVASFTFNRFCRVNWMAHGHPVYINTIDFFIYTSRLKSRLNKDAVASMLHRVSMYPRNNFRYFDRGTYLDRMYSHVLDTVIENRTHFAFVELSTKTARSRVRFENSKLPVFDFPPSRIPNDYPTHRFSDSVIKSRVDPFLFD